MNKRITVFVLSLTAFATVSSFTFFEAFHSGGMVFATGSPFDGGSTCAQPGCHANTNTTAPTVAITSSPAFISGNLYSPGQVYTINVVCSGPWPKYGFDLEILDTIDPSTAMDRGTFGTPSANCQMVVNAGLPTNVTQLMATGTGNTATFSFQWTAPQSGNALMYYSVLGVNFNSSNSGDKVKSGSMVIAANPNSVPVLNENIKDVITFPNPVKDKFTINYFLLEQGLMCLALYDEQGRRSAELLREYQNAGKQEVNIRIPEGIPPGVYFLKATIGKNMFTKRIIVAG